MRPISHRPFETLCRPAGVLALAATLALGGVAPGATAQDELRPPKLAAVDAPGPTTLRYTWADLKAPANGMRVTVYRDGESVHSLFYLTRSPSGTSTIDQYEDVLQPETRYCVGLEAMDNESSSEESERLCATTPAPPPPPPPPPPQPSDIAIRNIRGREDVEWSRVRGQPGVAYLIEIRNDGADADGTVAVGIQTSGVATLGEQIPVVTQGWAASGFTCAPRAAGGGANARMRCTGGSLKQGQTVNPAIVVRFTGPGFGYVHVSVGVASGGSEEDMSDNLLTLPIRVS